MNEDRPSTGSAQRSWRDRISQALLAEPKDREQLLGLLRDAQRRALFDADALAMIEGVLQVSEMQARDIMIPRSQMEVLNRDSSLEQMLPAIVDTGHSRFPVIGESRDEVLGILLAKDLLRYFVAGNEEAFNIREVLRPAVFIPESKRLNVLLKEFRANRNHIAIVVDEYGGVAGMVTIEDVLEQIVGEIEDEHDLDEDYYIRKHSATHFTVKALTPIEDFNEYFEAGFSDEEFDTIGGLLVHEFGHLPKRGETVTIDRYLFKVLRADNRRVHMLHLSVLPAPVTAPATGTVS
ncbi:MAG: HlyC/CorC family transporter [Gammaproteobacteria bacterium]|nr:HlyC/CorC family transporter [Gammaproteobacteria bacterium]